MDVRFDDMDDADDGDTVGYEVLRQTEILPVCEECRAVGSSEVDVDWVEDAGYYPEEQDRHVYLCEYCQSTD